jgi:hypothetical protein
VVEALCASATGAPQLAWVSEAALLRFPASGILRGEEGRLGAGRTSREEAKPGLKSWENRGARRTGAIAPGLRSCGSGTGAAMITVIAEGVDEDARLKLGSKPTPAAIGGW